MRARYIVVSSRPSKGALLTTVYSAGLRVSDVVRLRPEHIESSSMAIRVEQSKGRKDRYTVLSVYFPEYSQTLLACSSSPWLAFFLKKQEPAHADLYRSAYLLQRKKERHH